MAAYVKANHRHWDRWLPEFHFALNSAWHGSTGFTPAEVAVSRKLKPTAVLGPGTTRQARAAREGQCEPGTGRTYNEQRRTVHFQEGDGYTLTHSLMPTTLTWPKVGGSNK